MKIVRKIMENGTYVGGKEKGNTDYLKTYYDCLDVQNSSNKVAVVLSNEEIIGFEYSFFIYNGKEYDNVIFDNLKHLELEEGYYLSEDGKTVYASKGVLIPVGEITDITKVKCDSLEVAIYPFKDKAYSTSLCTTFITECTEYVYEVEM